MLAPAAAGAVARCAAQDAFIARILDGRFEGDWQTWV
jgi:hypothetical protein